jgi:hypothetical protein
MILPNGDFSEHWSSRADFGAGPVAASAIDELARRVRVTLRRDVGYRIEADRLTLIGTGTDGLGIGLQLTAAPDQLSVRTRQGGMTGG